MAINLKEIEQKVKPLGGKSKYDKEFIFDLLTAYGRSPSNITRLRNGQLNISNDNQTEVAQKNVVYFKPTNEDLYTTIDSLKSDPTVIRYSTRFVIVTDYNKLLAIDTKTNEPLDIDIRDIDKYYAFFLPWAGMEKAQFVSENHADVKAAEKMSKLFDEIVASNHGGNADYYHGLNVFFTRLLFCYFAEDTDIFGKSQFTNAIASYTQEDGSDVSHFLTELFTVLDIEDRTGYSSHISAFPYVNGQLFRDSRIIPDFSRKARDLLIECGAKLDWSNINPDIFGSMIQAVVNPGQRASLGMHYTSVPNIMKTIEPLFLDNLKEEINTNWDNSSKLEKVLDRIARIKIFDPACGSGNFLIIAYKELRKLEHTILERQGELGTTNATLLGSRVHIENFYGIEIDDFAHEVAILSLWLAKHQMNMEFYTKFGIDIPLIPLKESGNIAHGNAAQLKWSDVLRPRENEEIYLIGNPPYAGSSRQDMNQKKDLTKTLGHFDNYKNLDYIAIWFYKGSQYVAHNNSKLAFVSTNSICQGEQVALLWPHVFEMGVEIEFAYTPFKWANNAKHNAGVTCVIVSLAHKSNISSKKIYSEGLVYEATNINPYLASADNVIIPRRARPISAIPEMIYGNKPTDGGHLILSEEEKKSLMREYPESSVFIKRYMGADELLKSVKRYCIWIEDGDLELARSIKPIRERLDKVAEFRNDSKAKSTSDYANYPNRFKQRTYQPQSSIIVPSVTSERRKYQTVEFVDKNVVTSNRAFSIFEPSAFIFGILSSTMHSVWVNAVAGRLESRINYSSTICYNNFPLPPVTPDIKQLIEIRSMNVIDTRELYPDKTLAEMYDPNKMPYDLHQAHDGLDDVIDSLYRKKPFDNDEERLAHLFDLYKQMTAIKGKTK